MIIKCLLKDLKDYLSGVTFQVSFVKGYIHAETTADHSAHRYTIKAVQNGQRISYIMQVITWVR